MRKEYALQGVGHWSDAYPTLAYALKAARDVSVTVDILRRVPLPPGHQFGARWEKVATNYPAYKQSTT